jgi:invasion protein IalB
MKVNRHHKRIDPPLKDAVPKPRQTVAIKAMKKGKMLTVVSLTSTAAKYAFKISLAGFAEASPRIA